MSRARRLYRLIITTDRGAELLKYRLFMLAFAVAELARRAVRRDWRGISARLGRLKPSDTSPHLWIHGASNGELASIRPVIARLAQDHALLVTSNTDTGVDLVRGWVLKNVTATLAPLDLPGPTRRVMKRWDIKAHITSESDLWPVRIHQTPGPVLVLGARLTERSAKGWTRFGDMPKRLLERVTFLSAQDQASRQRFRDAGLPADRAGPVVDLKTLYSPPDAMPSEDLQAAFPRANTWLAASTHPGEEEIVLTAHRMALELSPELKLILAPRHPARADEIATMIADQNLTCARRSKGDDPAKAQVYLADTMGEMHLWYALAGRVFVAGSLTDRGGHTPYEPAFFGCALIHGPDVGNFQAAYTRLAQQDAAIEIADALTMAQALDALAEEAKQSEAGLRAKTALAQEADLDSLMEHIQNCLSNP